MDHRKEVLLGKGRRKQKTCKFQNSSVFLEGTETTPRYENLNGALEKIQEETTNSEEVDANPSADNEEPGEEKNDE